MAPKLRSLHFTLHPPRLCRLAVFSIKPSLLSLKVSGCTGSWRGGWFAFKGCRNHTCCLSLFNEIPAMRHKRGAQVKPKRPWLQNLVMMMVITITARDKTRRGDGEQPCCQLQRKSFSEFRREKQNFICRKFQAPSLQPGLLTMGGGPSVMSGNSWRCESA